MTCARQRGAGHDGRGKAASPPLRPTFTRDDSRAFPVAASLLLRRSPACPKRREGPGFVSACPRQSPCRVRSDGRAHDGFFCRQSTRSGLPEVPAAGFRVARPDMAARPRAQATEGAPSEKMKSPPRTFPGARRGGRRPHACGRELNFAWLPFEGRRRDPGRFQSETGPGRGAGRVRKFIRQDVSGARASGRHGASNRPGECLFRRGKGPGLHVRDRLFRTGRKARSLSAASYFFFMES